MNDFVNKVPQVKGEIEIILRNKETGEVIDHDRGSNIVVQQGYQNIIRAFSQNHSNEGTTDHFVIDNIKMGTDVGPTGTQENPDPAEIDYTKDNQTLISDGVITSPEQASTFDYNEFSITYSDYSVTYNITTNGDGILNNHFDANVIDFSFTSLVIYASSNSPYPIIAYRRFPVKTVTRIVDIDISWTLYFNI